MNNQFYTAEAPVLFLDIDGVLNDHQYNPRSKSNTLLPRQVKHLNTIIDAVAPAIVIASAWRYMINGGAITTQGFNYLLRTHGVDARVNVIGTTAPDESIPRRDDQILEWIAVHQLIVPWAVVDDLDKCEMTGVAHRLV